MRISLSFFLNSTADYYWPSFLITVAMLLFSFPLSITVVVKAILAVSLYLSYRFLGKGEKRTFYNNLGCRILFLVVAVFFFDLVITILLFQIPLFL